VYSNKNLHQFKVQGDNEMRKPFDDAVATERGWAHPETGELLVSIRGLPDTIAYYRPNAGPVLSWKPLAEDTPKKERKTKVAEAVEEIVVPVTLEVDAVQIEEVAEVKVDPESGLRITYTTSDEITFTFQLVGIEGEPQKAQWTFEDGKPLNRKKGFGDAFDRTFNTPGKHEVRALLTYSDGDRCVSTAVTVKE
jgi:hypothetical protein